MGLFLLCPWRKSPEHHSRIIRSSAREGFNAMVQWCVPHNPFEVPHSTPSNCFALYGQLFSLCQNVWTTNIVKVETFLIQDMAFPFSCQLQSIEGMYLALHTSSENDNALFLMYRYVGSLSITSLKAFCDTIWQKLYWVLLVPPSVCNEQAIAVVKIGWWMLSIPIFLPVLRNALW